MQPCYFHTSQPCPAVAHDATALPPRCSHPLTAVAEEGIDVKSCQLVVRFDLPTSAQARSSSACDPDHALGAMAQFVRVTDQDCLPKQNWRY